MNMFNQISKCKSSAMFSITTTTTTFLKSFRVKKLNNNNNKEKEQAIKQKPMMDHINFFYCSQLNERTCDIKKWLK